MVPRAVLRTGRPRTKVKVLTIYQELVVDMSELTAGEIKKFKVAELKVELTKRGLSTKGKKDELASRLLDAIQGLDRTVTDENDADESEAVDTEESAASQEDTSQNINGDAVAIQEVETPQVEDAEMQEDKEADEGGKHGQTEDEAVMADDDAQEVAQKEGNLCSCCHEVSYQQSPVQFISEVFHEGFRR